MSKKALITGSSRGIGAEIARILARDGFEVTINYLNSREKALALASELGCEAVRADVSDPIQARNLVSSAGEVDILVNNAGISYFGLLTDTDPDDWQRVFDVNTRGAFLCTRAVIPAMVRKRSGCIINISSVWGRTGASCEAAYSSSKAALIGFTKAMAKELGPSGIRVNAVAPGAIMTDMLSVVSPEALEEFRQETPLGRLGRTEDVAELVSFLASDRAGFITGQIIGVDGGVVI